MIKRHHNWFGPSGRVMRGQKVHQCNAVAAARNGNADPLKTAGRQ